MGSVEIDQQGAFTGNNNRIKRASFGLAAATLSGPAGECFLLGTLKSNTWHLYHHDNRTTLHDDWTMVPVPADRPLCCLAAKMTPGGGLMVYAGTNDGVYVYDQAADAWQAWNDVVDRQALPWPARRLLPWHGKMTYTGQQRPNAACGDGNCRGIGNR